MTLMAGCRAAVAVATLLAARAAAAQASAPVAGDGFEVEHYEVALRPDLATTALSGTETIVLKSTRNGLDRLVFSPNALRLRDATLDGQPVAVASTFDGIAFSPAHALGKGDRATLRFQMSGVPAQGIVRTGNGLYTSYFACDWMVCLQDRPGNKAHFSLDLYLPAGIASLGIGRALPLLPFSDGLVLHRWRSTRAYSAYLFGFAAGIFAQEAVGTSVGELVYLDGTGRERNLAETFSQTRSIAQFLADKAGMGLPDRRYTQLLVPKREAQEAATFSLIGEEELDRERQQPSNAWIIAHEMAHQWWGNLVTCASWQDFWLNEGIATFMVAAWKERAFGPSAYQEELEGAQRRLERARASGFDKPLAWSGAYPSLGIRRAIQYSKGALFVDHLRNVLGEEAFWNGIRRFTREHAGKTATSQDFQVAMEKASGSDLSSLFREWVYGDS
ncbi:M1 family aminopeptidase [Stenotrophomonas sp. MMGLT7]|uniref:M1 family metallopeptidase n=1 Tax=Stenotrophomonas sp. MMGLT7 TaxID=2901227 RepID=UPI001E5B19FD|nr:M1 family aminopeptidase [Stenotrophomonas sp. MMGLT7]MCD7097964.1 M1 family peptidase [Stenotrophomonas sp. MMGLT7]